MNETTINNDSRQAMNLYSPSGYAMPFELNAGQALNILKKHGWQDPLCTEQEHFHHGIDFEVSKGTWLKALATGVVSGINSDLQNGFNITVCYKNYAEKNENIYEVIYSHISEALCTFGHNVKAGDNIARSEGILHVEVRFNGEEVDPMEFLVMIRDNLMMESQIHMDGENPEIATMDMDVHTSFDASKAEIDQLMNRYIKNYFQDLFQGNYHVPQSTESGLRDAFMKCAETGCFYEHTASNMNPLGLGKKSICLIEYIQTMLIHDFLNYLALSRGLFLSTMSESDKKKLLTVQ